MLLFKRGMGELESEFPKVEERERDGEAVIDGKKGNLTSQAQDQKKPERNEKRLGVREQHKAGEKKKRIAWLGWAPKITKRYPSPHQQN